MGRAALTSPAPFTDADALAAEIVRRLGGRVMLGLPLGLGKAATVANALYRLAERDASVRLTVLTALSLEPPRPNSELERRFLEPVIARTVGGYPRLLYAEAAREGRLPPNVRVEEFFLQAGTRLGSPEAQQDYLSVNYTHALPRLLERGVNVVAQLVAARGAGAGRRFSLSCNSDITVDLLRRREAGGTDFLLVGEVNGELPFMGGDADLPAAAFALTLEGADFPLFGPPKEPVDAARYAIGFHVASLVPDGGTLQLGIGATSDAICQALIVRHRSPALFAETLARLAPGGGGVERHVGPFEQGLYAATEMFVDGFLHLARAGVLTRQVRGAVLHGGFFIGPRDFYRALRDMPEAERARFAMTAISFTNALYGHEDQARAERPHARFANSAMAATLLGEVASDTLEDGRVVSGVGGQYDFVAQAFALGPDARSILTLGSTREEDGRPRSTLCWRYAGATIPRHLRDIVVTEYGVADLRGRTDAETIEAMLGVADARFAPRLSRRAVRAGKLAGGDRSALWSANTPAELDRRLGAARLAGALSPFPFGTDFTDEERQLLPALARLKAAQGSPIRLARLLKRGAAVSADSVTAPLLARLDLLAPTSARERVTAALVRGALAAEAD